MNTLLRFALGVANVPATDIDDLDKALPGLGRLSQDMQQLRPLIESAMPHITALLPLIQQATPIVKAAYPDIVAVLPTLEEFIHLAQGKK